MYKNKTIMHFLLNQMVTSSFHTNPQTIQPLINSRTFSIGIDDADRNTDFLRL